MRLTDVMSSLDLAVYPMLALVLFAGVFVLVMLRAWRTPTKQMEQWSAIPLDEAASEENRS